MPENSTCDAKIVLTSDFSFGLVEVTLKLRALNDVRRDDRETEWHEPCWPKWIWATHFLRMRVSLLTFRFFEAWVNEKGNLWVHAVGQRRQELNFACNPISFQKLLVVPQRDHSWGVFYKQLSGEQILQTLAIPCYALQILRIPWALVRCPALCSFLVFK